MKGLLLYPLIVIVVSFGLTLVLSVTFSRFLANFYQFSTVFAHGSRAFVGAASVWVPPVLLALAAILGVVAISIPGVRARLRWRLPAFREASLAQLASAMALMLKNGTTLAEALALVHALEATTPAGKTIGQWRQLVASGQGKPSQWPVTAKPFPPLFLWLVKQSGEDPAAGFQKAAEIYQSRASARIEMALYGALPVSILLVGQMVFWQIYPLMRNMIWLMNSLPSTPTFSMR